MCGVVLLGLLDTLFLGFTRFLLALLARVMSVGVLCPPPQQAERSEEQPAEGSSSGASRTKSAGETIEGRSVHEELLTTSTRRRFGAVRGAVYLCGAA
jgi:hypothetical protein